MGLPVTAQGVPRVPRWGMMLGAFTPLGTEKVCLLFYKKGGVCVPEEAPPSPPPAWAPRGTVVGASGPVMRVSRREGRSQCRAGCG